MFLSIPGNPNYTLIDLFVPMYGENNSTTFPSYGKNSDINYTANGNAKISIAQSKWGDGSGYFDGAGDYISGSYSAELPSAWTIEFWVYLVDYASTRGLFQDGSLGIGAYVKTDGAIEISSNRDYIGNLGFYTTTNSSAITSETWTHLAFVKHDTNAGCNIFVNGTSMSVTSNWASNTISRSYNTTMKIGYTDKAGDSYLYGYMNDFIIYSSDIYYVDFIPTRSIFYKPDITTRITGEYSFLNTARSGY